MIDTVPDHSIKHPFQNAPTVTRWILPSLVLVFALLAWWSRFMTDDAFISFRYAANLVDGHGLVWNPGERVEGYTNFLWTLLISGAIYVGINPVHASFFLGIGSFCLTLTFTYKLSVRIFQSQSRALVALLLLGMNYTFLAYATGGIETQLQTSLFVVSVYLLFQLIHEPQSRTLALLSLIAAMALLLRLDSSVILAPVLLAASFFVLKQKTNNHSRLSKILLLLAPVGCITAVWLIWKLSYYGDILPNTFYAKVDSNHFDAGIAYIYKFLISYLLFPFPLFIAAALMSKHARKNIFVLVLTGVSSLWAFYVAAVGGDFMEFRFLVPVLPFFFILITWLIFSIVKEKTIRIGMFALVLLGDLHHFITYPRFWNRMPFGYVEPIGRLNQWVYGEDTAWVEIGNVLGRQVKQDSNVVIAVTAAGAIPYYSRLIAVDMHGLNDRWIAKHGDEWGEKVGHQKIARLDYLTKRNVNLVIGHPFLIDSNAKFQKDYSEQDIQRWVLRNPDHQEVLVNAKILEIPINNRKKLVTLYLSGAPVLDALISANRWQLHSIE